MASSSTQRTTTSRSNGVRDDTPSNNNGCVTSRRRSPFVRVLLRHLLTHRRKIRTKSASQQITDTSAQELEVLTTEAALLCGASCRICFEGPLVEQEGQESNMLVAPCRCSGGSKWIHMKCLRQWQVQVQFGSFQPATSTAATVCNVCMGPYQIGPPSIMKLRSNLFNKGTLLVYSPNQAASTFHKTVVSLLNHPNNNSCPYGLIFNMPLEHQGRVSMGDERLDSVVSWRRGGPVCGGRLGVNKYIVAHTRPPSVDQQQKGPFLSIPVFDNSEQQEDGQNRRLYVLVSAVDRRPLVPALFSRDELAAVVKTLVDPKEQEQGVGETVDSVDQVFCFLGYCKWRSGQLDREVQRGTWRVCNNGNDHDVVRNDVTGLWHEMTQSDSSRLLSPAQLLEDLE